MGISSIIYKYGGIDWWAMVLCEVRNGLFIIIIMYVYLLIPTISAIDIIDKIGKITTSYL